MLINEKLCEFTITFPIFYTLPRFMYIFTKRNKHLKIEKKKFELK